MRHPKFLALSMLLVVMLTSNVSSTSAAATAAKDGRDHIPGKVIHVIEHAITDSVVDVEPAGDSLGDILAFGNPIFDADNEDAVGRDQGYCVRTNLGESWECNWTVILNRGSITVEGPFYDDLRYSEFAITGGTGAYRNARGEMTLHARDAAGTEFDFVYHIIG